MTPIDASAVELVLENRMFLYGLAARTYACEPDQTMLSTLLDEHTEGEVALLEDDYTDQLVGLYKRVCALAQRADGCAAGALPVAQLSRDYVNAFIGPSANPVPAWETVCRSGRAVLFQKGLLDVRGAYERAGFRSVRFPQVADDFIGIELDFLAKLAESAYVAFSEGDCRECCKRLRQSLEFLDDHLLTWIGDLTEKMEERHGNTFYTRFTEFVSLFALRDRDVVGLLLDDVLCADA